MSSLFDFAVMTIFAREVLEGSIIIGEYRTIILRGNSLAEGILREEALRAVTKASLFATLLAVIVICAVAIPLAVIGKGFDSKSSNIVEGVSKIVAAVCLLGLSLKMPKFLGVYGSAKRKCCLRCMRCMCCKRKDKEEGNGGLTLRNIYFNLMWNIWREVAECGVFLIPFFLSGEGLKAIPVSAVIGSLFGLLLGLGIYYANRKLKHKVGLTVFAVLLFVFLSAGLFAGGCHKLEMELGMTRVVWQLHGSFWSVDRLPMTILKPFGYHDTRTLLQIICYWSWIAVSALLHYRKYLRAEKIEPETKEGSLQESADTRQLSFVDGLEEVDTLELGESSLEGDRDAVQDSFKRTSEEVVEEEKDENDISQSL